MIKPKTNRAGALLLVLALAGCGEEPPPPRFPVTFHAQADRGTPLAGVRVTANGEPIGETDEEGRLHVDLTGPEGAPVQVGASCPEGYRQPTSLPTISLRHVVSLDPQAAAAGLQVTIPCPPRTRRGVVVVRAGGAQPQAGLPVLIEGREVTRTDASGAAHVALELEPGESFQVELSTAALPLLRPQSPVANFTFPDADELFVFDQSFTAPEPERPRTSSRRRRRSSDWMSPSSSSLPVRLGRH